MKTCHEWTRIEYIEATCPHCHVIDTYCKPGLGKNTVVMCVKCKKKFKLGEQE